MNRIWPIILKFLVLFLALCLIAIIQLPDDKLHLIACNVGQGDATLLVYKNTQILIDGGPNSEVLNCLGKYLPFWDRELELIILTHPDSDHFRGLIDVFKDYKVDYYMANDLGIGKQEYQLLEKWVGGSGSRVIRPYGGQSLRLELIYLDTLAPLGSLRASDLTALNKKEVSDSETNSYSIVSLIRFKNFRALLTADMTNELSDKISQDLSLDRIDYIKIPHHGSKNGVTINLLKGIDPKLAVISVGKNLYGHPSKEVLNMLKNLGIKYLRTDEVGDIEVISDGEKFWLK